MKLLGLGAAALALFSGADAMAGEGCCASKKQIVKTPLLEKAEGLQGRWAKLAAAPVEMSQADQETCAKAMETLSKSCPVCKQMPETVGFLTAALAVSNALERSCQEFCASGEMAKMEMPTEIKAAMGEHAALLHSSKATLGAAFASFGGESKDKCCADGAAACSAEAKKNCGGDLECYATLDKKADKLLAAWGEIPAQFAGLAGEEKTRLQSAMATMKKINPEHCALFHETVQVGAQLLGRAVEIEGKLSANCPLKKSVEAGTASDQEKSMHKALSARHGLLKKAADLLSKMGKTLDPSAMNPIFSQAQ